MDQSYYFFLNQKLTCNAFSATAYPSVQSIGLTPVSNFRASNLPLNQAYFGPQRYAGIFHCQLILFITSSSILSDKTQANLTPINTRPWRIQIGPSLNNHLLST